MSSNILVYLIIPLAGVSIFALIKKKWKLLALFAILLALDIIAYNIFVQIEKRRIERKANIELIETAIQRWAVLHNRKPGTPVTFEDIHECMDHSRKYNTVADLDVGNQHIVISCVGSNVFYQTK